MNFINNLIPNISSNTIYKAAAISAVIEGIGGLVYGCGWLYPEIFKNAVQSYQDATQSLTRSINCAITPLYVGSGMNKDQYHHSLYQDEYGTAHPTYKTMESIMLWSTNFTIGMVKNIANSFGEVVDFKGLSEEILKTTPRTKERLINLAPEFQKAHTPLAQIYNIFQDAMRDYCQGDNMRLKTHYYEVLMNIKTAALTIAMTNFCQREKVCEGLSLSG